MEVAVRQNLQDDRMSNCHSFGSYYHPSSQSRKISIGITVDSSIKKKPAATKKDEIITVDSSTKKKPAATKKDEVKVPNSKRTNLNKANFMQAKKKGEGVTAATKGKQTEATDQVSSPWISTRSFNQNASISETAPCTKQASKRPITGGRQTKPNGLKDAQIAHSVQFFANQTSILQSGDSHQKKFSGTTYKRKGGKNGSQEQVEEFTFATAQEAIVSDKVVMADQTDKTENRTETLRMQLWQILGTVSSPKIQHSNSQACDIGANKLKPEQVVDPVIDMVLRPRKDSDTIETDSESPNQPTSRPLTRSLTRKRVSTKMGENKTKTGLSSSTKQKTQMNIFSFEEGRSRKQSGAVHFGSLLSMQKKSQRKSSNIEPHKITFSENNNADEHQRANNNDDSPPNAEKTSSLGHKVDSFHDCAPEDRRDFFESKNIIQEKDIGQSSESKKMNQRADNKDSAENRDHQEDCSSSWKNVVEPPDEFQSPTFAIRTPILSPSPCSTPTTVQMEQDVQSPELEGRRFNVESIRCFRTLESSKPDCSGSDTETESPAGAEKFQDFLPRRQSPAKEKRDAEDELAEFSSEDEDPGCHEDGSPIIKGYDCHRDSSLETRTVEKPNSMSFPTKRLWDYGGIRYDEFSPPLPSSEGIVEGDWFQEPSEQNQEDELTRAVTMFALALEKFRRKMDSATKKQSSEILMSVSEGIHLQLQNVESQIQTDIGKLTTLSKSKRKRLETRFEEQQEQLKLIHQKFKDDVHHHLQDCRSTVEVLEAHQTELKGTLKKQRTSHQKLILHLEQAVETQFDDAQRRITTVHELAREKMLQLKCVIAEGLKEHILN